MTPDQLRDRRTHHGLTQVQFAALLDVDRVSVGRWERGEVPIPRLAELGIEVLDLRAQVREMLIV